MLKHPVAHTHTHTISRAGSCRAHDLQHLLHLALNIHGFHLPIGGPLSIKSSLKMPQTPFQHFVWTCGVWRPIWTLTRHFTFTLNYFTWSVKLTFWDCEIPACQTWQRQHSENLWTHWKTNSWNWAKLKSGGLSKFCRHTVHDADVQVLLSCLRK